MKNNVVNNLPASIHQRLLNNARRTHRPFIEVLQYFAIERFLYRLSKSPHSEKFILKGALMFSVWEPGLPRPTKDIDLLGRTKNEISAIVDIMREICAVKTEHPDALSFESAGVEGERITENADYQGVRIFFPCKLGKARISMRIDIGFGDIVFPAAKKITFPVILDMPKPVIRCYSRESVIAEKLEAMIKLDIINSRMKDFFDIWMLSRQFDFQGDTLAGAIKKTFENRETKLTKKPFIFSDIFAMGREKQTQWSAFIRKNKLAGAPKAFSDTVYAIAGFVKPVLAALSGNKSFSSSWRAPGPWHH